MLIPLSVPVLRCFNSIKVQLEQNITAAQLAKDMFQFHKGTIRTIRCYHQHEKYSKFQFHKGTIRT